MSTKTNEAMLVSIKQYNKTAREVKAKKEGFASAAAFISFLEIVIKNGEGHHIYVTPKNPSAPTSKKDKQVKAVIGKTRPTIHVIDILDSSGSMSGGKHTNSLKGINLGVVQLRQDVAEVDYTYTLCDFSDDIRLVYITAQLDSVGNFTSRTRNATALYDAIGDTVNAVRNTVHAGDKVLVNVYTDGQENTSKRFRANQIASIIDELSQVGWTFTFIGTSQDVAYAQRNLKFDASNTLVHDNTGAGMEKAFTTNSVSRTAYSAKVSAGEDVSKGFYKDIN